MSRNFKSIFVGVLILSSAAVGVTDSNAAPVATIEARNAIVHEVYKKGMSSVFMAIENTAKKSKTAKEFILAIAQLSEEDRKFVEASLKNEPPPKIMQIQNGIEMEIGGSRSKLTLGQAIGEILFDGVSVPLSHESLKQQVEKSRASSARNSRLHGFAILVPIADAQMWRMVAELSLAAVKYIVKTTAIGTAAGVGLGAIGGCGLGIAIKDEATEWPAVCASSAWEGIKLVGGLGFLTGGVTGVASSPIQFVSFPDDVLSKAGFSTSEIALYNSRVKVLVKGVGVVGAILMAGALGKTLLEAEGAKIECGDGGAYAIVPLHLGAGKRPPVMSFSDQKLRIFDTELPTNEGAIRDFLITKQKYSTEQAASIAELTIKEHHQRVGECLENPNKTLNVMFSDAKKLVPAAGQKKGEATH